MQETAIPAALPLGALLGMGATGAAAPEDTVHLWEKQEIVLTASQSSSNAYLEVEVWVDLQGPGFHLHAVSNREFRSKNIYFKNPTAPADIVGINGYIIEGRVHAHITLANADRAFGGHLERGTNVFTFAAVTIGVLSADVDLSRLDDKTYR